MTQASIRAAFEPGRASVVVAKNPLVPDTFWLLARSEWGSSGRTPASAIEVPLERFVRNLGWLRPMCARFHVGIEWDTGAKRLMERMGGDRRSLRELLQGRSPHQPEKTEDSLTRAGFVRKLLPFQVRDLKRLLSLPHGANFSVPGAGKTTVTYALYAYGRGQGNIERLLVVAPMSAYEAWTDEATKCFLHAPPIHIFTGGGLPQSAEIVLLNYHRLPIAFRDLARWVGDKATQVVLDEAHRMKRGWSGQWGSACLSLSFLAARRDVLTGTPAPQSVTDLVTILEFLWPGQATFILGNSRRRDEPQDGSSRLARRIKPLFVRTTKTELSLPPPTYRAHVLPLVGLHAEVYSALLDQYFGKYALEDRDRVTFAQMGMVVMYLLEAATNPALLVAGSSQYDPIPFAHPPLDVPAGSRLADLLRSYGSYETPAKFSALKTLLSTNAQAGRKTIVWSSFVRNIMTLENIFAAYEPAVIHGGVPFEVAGAGIKRTRQQELRRFRTDPSCLVLFANPATTAEGISLHDICHDAVYLDRTFNAGHYLQSVDRIHRLGLPAGTQTNITHLLTKGTVDEIVDVRIRDKVQVLGTLLSDADVVTMMLPDEEDYGTVLDEEQDLAALVAHLQDTTKSR